MSKAYIINYIITSFKFGYKPTEYGTDMPKHVEVVKCHTFMYACNMCIDLVL